MNIFAKHKMSWKATLLMALIMGAAAGLIRQVSYLDNTSASDFLISGEWWIMLSLFLLGGRGKTGIGTFFRILVFWLIAFTLMLIVQLPATGFDGMLSYLKEHGVLLLVISALLAIGSVLTQVGGSFGGVILALMNTVASVFAISHTMHSTLPHHLISVILTICAVIASTLALSDKKVGRAVSFSVLIVLIIVCLLLSFRLGLTLPPLDL